MNKDKNIASAKAVFAKDKSIKELYFTNDGQAFKGFEAAKTHQKEITGSVDELHRVKNGDYEGPTVTITEDVVGGAEEVAVDEAAGADETGGKVEGKGKGKAEVKE
jgi:hypothetical protein